MIDAKAQHAVNTYPGGFGDVEATEAGCASVFLRFDVSGPAPISSGTGAD